MTAAILVVEGNAADLEGHAPSVQLEASFFEVTSCAAQLADTDQRAILHLVAFSLAPEADVTQLLVRVVPRAIDCGLDAAYLPRVHSGCCGGEGIGDMAAEAAVAVGTGEAACGLSEGVPVVRQLFA